jgi:hypothetical protein
MEGNAAFLQEPETYTFPVVFADGGTLAQVPLTGVNFESVPVGTTINLDNTNTSIQRYHDEQDNADYFRVIQGSESEGYEIHDKLGVPYVSSSENVVLSDPPNNCSYSVNPSTGNITPMY